MQSIEVRIVFLFLFLSCVSALRNCGELEKNDLIRHILEEDSKPLPYQNKIDQLFDAFDENDSQRMEEIYHYLANTTIYDLDDSDSMVNSEYAGIKYVVSFFQWKIITTNFNTNVRLKLVNVSSVA